MPVRHSSSSKSPYYRRGDSGNESVKKYQDVESQDTTGREQATNANQHDTARANGGEG